MSSWLCCASFSQLGSSYGRESLSSVLSTSVSFNSSFSVINKLLMVQQLIAASCMHSCLQHMELSSLHMLQAYCCTLQAGEHH